MYPRAITTIKQIELTSKCNLACRYCPHLKMKRKKEHMKWHTFERTLDWVRWFVYQGTQREVALTGIGEPLMHPQFVRIVKTVRDVIGWSNPITFSTNGILLTEKLCQQLKYYKPEIFISLHRPEIAGKAIEIAKKYGLFRNYNDSFVTSSMNWAGTVNWYVSAPSTICDFLMRGWAVVLADGDITTCCMDSEKLGLIGNVFNNIPEKTYMDPYSLCESCYMTVPDKIDLSGKAVFKFVAEEVVNMRGEEYG